jgi:hypothetical protein
MNEICSWFKCRVCNFNFWDIFFGLYNRSKEKVKLYIMFEYVGIDKVDISPSCWVRKIYQQRFFNIDLQCQELRVEWAESLGNLGMELLCILYGALVIVTSSIIGCLLFTCSSLKSAAAPRKRREGSQQTDFGSKRNNSVIKKESWHASTVPIKAIGKVKWYNFSVFWWSDWISRGKR